MRTSFIPQHMADMPVVPHVRTPPAYVNPTPYVSAGSGLRSASFANWTHSGDYPLQALAADVEPELDYSTDSGQIVGIDRAGKTINVWTVNSSGILALSTSFDCWAAIDPNIAMTEVFLALRAACRVNETDILALIATANNGGSYYHRASLVLFRNVGGTWTYVSRTIVFTTPVTDTYYGLEGFGKMCRVGDGQFAGGFLVRSNLSTPTYLPRLFAASVNGDVVTMYTVDPGGTSHYNQRSCAIATAGNGNAVFRSYNEVFAVRHFGNAIGYAKLSISSGYNYLSSIAPGAVLMYRMDTNNFSYIEVYTVTSATFALSTTYGIPSSVLPAIGTNAACGRTADDEFILIASNNNSGLGDGTSIRGQRFSVKADKTVAPVGSSYVMANTGFGSTPDEPNRQRNGGCVLPDGRLLIGTSTSDNTFRYFVLRNA